MNRTLYLLCGVPGSGKTWVCRQLEDAFNWVPHDDHLDDLIPALVSALRQSDKPLITECPFAERHLREKLEYHGFDVRPVFIVEDPETVRRRYFERERKPIGKASLTRAATILNRAKEWDAPYGTSAEVLKYLSEKA